MILVVKSLSKFKMCSKIPKFSKTSSDFGPRMIFETWIHGPPCLYRGREWAIEDKILGWARTYKSFWGSPFNVLKICLGTSKSGGIEGNSIIPMMVHI